MDSQDQQSHAKQYSSRADAIRALLPAVRFPETRATLQTLAADYLRLAEFAAAMDRASQECEYNATRLALAKRWSEMQSLSDKFLDVRAGALRTRADFIRVELELGLTLLDGAMTTRVSKNSRRCIRNAITALRTADSFLALEPRLLHTDGIAASREKLRARLLEVIAEHSN